MKLKLLLTNLLILSIIGSGLTISILYGAAHENNTKSSNNIIYVGGTGPNNYTTIQDGINAATDGDTVFVYNRTYTERVSINKMVNLIGENATIYEDFGGPIIAVDISSNFVNINGFTIKFVGRHIEESVGISVNSGNNTIKYCVISGFETGIGLEDGASNNTITNCIISNNIGAGIFLGVKYIPSPGPTNNVILNCTISMNYRGVYILYSCYNRVYHNNFINNTYQAIDTSADVFSANLWDDNISKGNYWSDYTDMDENGDGIGEISYNISNGNNRDRYPLMKPLDFVSPGAVVLYNPLLITQTSLTLTWSQNTDTDFVRYEIYQSMFSGVLGNLIHIVQNNTATSYVINDLNSSTTYYFIVRVVDMCDLYTDSNQVSGTTLYHQEETKKTRFIPSFEVSYLILILGISAILVKRKGLKI